MRTVAIDRFDRGDFQNAVVALRGLTRAHPEDGFVWLELARGSKNLKLYGEAIVAFKRALDLGQGWPNQRAYDIARCYERSGQRAQALKWLKKALDVGFEDRPSIAQDEDLRGLRGVPTFDALCGQLPKRHLTRTQGWRYDIDFLLGEIKRLSYSFRSTPLPTSLLRAATDLKLQVPALADATIAVRIQKIVAALHNGHSIILPVASRVTFHQLPLHFYIFPEGLYVIDAAQPYAGLIGGRVLSFEGIPTKTLLNRLPELVSRDNPMGLKWLAPQYLKILEIQRYLGAKSSGPKLRLKVLDTHQTVVDKVVRANGFVPEDDKLIPSKLTNLPSPLYLQNVSTNYSETWLAGSQVLYVQFNQVRDGQAETLPDFGVRLRKLIADKEPSDVIVDVRHNNGGSADLAKNLIQTLVSFDVTHPSGHLFVITGRNTFSAAQNFINALDNQANPVFVGEPSSSSPTSIGEDTNVVLPYSRVRGSIASRLQTADPGDHRQWIPPKIPVELTAADYFSNRDPALEAVLLVIRGRVLSAVRVTDLHTGRHGLQSAPAPQLRRVVSCSGTLRPYNQH